MDFSIEKKGYNRAEVDRYLETHDREMRKIQDDQIDRIRALRKEADELRKKLDDYSGRERLIGNTLVVAVARAEEIEREAKKKYEKELSALKAFQSKWQKYYDHLLEHYPMDERISKVKSVNSAMERILSDMTKNVPTGVEEKRIAPVAPTREKHESDSEQEARYAEELGRLEGSSKGINMSAVTSALTDAMMEDERFERIATGWAQGIAPKEISDYLDDRVKKSPVGNIDSRTGVNASALNTTLGTNGFSFAEALKPSDSLEDIMADFGLDDGKKKKK